MNRKGCSNSEVPPHSHIENHEEAIPIRQLAPKGVVREIVNGIPVPQSVLVWVPSPLAKPAVAEVPAVAKGVTHDTSVGARLLLDSTNALLSHGGRQPVARGEPAQ